MRIAHLLSTAALLTFSVSALHAQEVDRTVKDGGIMIAGWKGRVDRKAASQGKTVKDSKLVADGTKGYRLSVGPAGDFWTDKNVAKGDFEVKASFDELKMTASHPHSYGLFIGGHDLDSDNETLLYCIAYGNGTYAVKTFHGATVTTLVDPSPNAVLHKADANGESTNEIGWRVKGNDVSCVINGTAVKTFSKADVMGPTKLTSTDGIYGIRVSHNLELRISNIDKK